MTNITSTVIRLLTPDGTLVVETNDSAVKVTVEGDGGLVITGAGPEEIRLRPGSYRVHADKDGKPIPLDKDLVTVTRGGRAIVKVKLESSSSPVAAKAEKGAFVRLGGGKGVAERNFDTLSEAVQSASDGDTIEVRGNGPFVTQAVSLGRKSLTIRAAAGFRPLIKGNVGETYAFLSSQGPLVLEGLELHMTGRQGSITVLSELGPLHVANCRFVLYGSHSLATDTPSCAVRNCEFIDTAIGSNHVSSILPKDGHLTLENNVLGNPLGATFNLRWLHRGLHNSTVHLRHNTVISPDVIILQHLVVVPESAEPGAAPGRQPVQVNVSENLFDSNARPECIFSLLLPPAWYWQDAKPLSAEEAERLLPRLMAWREDRNLYGKVLTFQSFRRVNVPGGPEAERIDEPLPAARTFADWQRLWKAGDSGSAEGTIRYEGGDVVAKMMAAPERITPDDVRLRPDSEGYRAGKDGKDLGANVDLVGPGPAYERWKKTPEYQQWLKDSGQTR